MLKHPPRTVVPPPPKRFTAMCSKITPDGQEVEWIISPNLTEAVKCYISEERGGTVASRGNLIIMLLCNLPLSSLLLLFRRLLLPNPPSQCQEIFADYNCIRQSPFASSSSCSKCWLSLFYLSFSAGESHGSGQKELNLFGVYLSLSGLALCAIIAVVIIIKRRARKVVSVTDQSQQQSSDGDSGENVTPPPQDGQQK